MINLKTPFEYAGLSYTHAAIRKLTIDAKEQQIHLVVGYGNDELPFSENVPLRRFVIRRDTMKGEGRSWELPKGYFSTLISGVGGPLLSTLEQRLVIAGIFEGQVP